MSPEEIHSLLEGRLLAARKAAEEAQAKLASTEQARAQVSSDFAALQSTYKSRLESFNSYLDKRNQQKLVIGIAMIVGGFAGWYLQKRYDWRLPGMALVGAGIAFTATIVTEDETTQNALQYGGLAMALTSVLFVFHLPKPTTNAA